MDDILHRAASVLTRSGDDFFPAAVAEITAALDAQLVLIGELVDDDEIRTVAISRHGVTAEPLTYRLKGSAAEPLASQPVSACVAEACDRFPGDPQITSVGAQSVIAVRLTDTKDRFIGVVLAACVRPQTAAEEGTALLQILAGRIAAELQRARSERELRESEAHLRQVQQVEAIGRLAGGIAHDFNNLLMIMTGYAEILRERHGPSREVTELVAAAHRATTLTRHLLAYGRRQVLHIERLDLNDVVRHVCGMLAPIISARVAVDTSLDEALPPVEADRAQFEQLLLNLALNARDAMPAGGRLQLSTRLERVNQPYRQMPAGTYVCLEVSDTGVGMTAEVKAHIFEPFYTTKGARGTGLGLSSVYGVVKQSNGFIWCDSTPGTGTTFRIYLHAARRARTAPKPVGTTPESVPALARRPAVLVVDDELTVRRWVSRILQARGYDVADVEDAAAALEQMRDPVRRPALVVTDIVMPGVNGTRLAEDIERQWPDTRLLFVSGFADSTAVRAAAVLSRVPVLRKPFTPEQVIAAVRQAFDEPPPADEASRVA
jgi:signal transduction histidine kinase/ActR/RegA family two-component response regulator